jgi:integrase
MRQSDNPPPPKGGFEVGARGLGRVYRRGKVWWIEYWLRGRQYRESSDSEVEEDAVNLLRQRQGEIGRGRPVGLRVERTTFEDMAALLTEDYKNNGRRSLGRVLRTLKHLRGTFGRARAVEVTPQSVSAYISRRLAKGAAPGTVGNELASLGRMLTLAVRAGLLESRPRLPGITVRNVRKGFFEEPQVRAVLHGLPEDVRSFVEFGYLTGWRFSEVRALAWKQVDFQAGVARLEPGTTKNDEGREFPFSALPALARLLHSQRERTTALERRTQQVIPWVFHRSGRPIRSFRDVWRRACREAGVPGRLFHDLRRTAVRNLERAGVPRSVAMKLTGHRTELVYRRYAIVSEADLAEGVTKLAALHATSRTVPAQRAINLDRESAAEDAQAAAVPGGRPPYTTSIASP